MALSPASNRWVRNGPRRATASSLSLLAAVLIALSASVAAAAGRQPPDPPPAAPAPSPGEREAGSDLEQLSRLSLEELMSIEITSVAGIPHSWFDTPAAIYVITGEEIRRSGHRSLAEALRLAPGVFVGKFDSHHWIVSPRGFAGGLANKTLVLLDGREVYDPLAGGTYWDVLDLVLDDVDRIEVIRGPGPTLWGANAVNGVINIISKDAASTQGTLLAGGGGSYERAFASARHGGKLGEHGFYRTSAKYTDRGPLDQVGPGDAGDDWRMGRAQFRADFERGDEITITLDGDAYRSFELDHRVLTPVPAALPTFSLLDFEGRVRGGHLLGRVERRGSEGEGWTMQGYYHRADRRERDFSVDRDTFDLDYRRHLAPTARQEIIGGLGYRHISDDTMASPVQAVDPASRSIDTWSGFLQDTITLVPERWFAMVGAKLEYDDRIDFAVQPSARVWFRPDQRQMWWAAVSRPIREPSRVEEDTRTTLFFADPGALAGRPTGAIVPFLLTGNPDLEPEAILAWELGYRTRPADRVTTDFALFHNHYDDYIFVPPQGLGSFNNEGEAESFGGEAALTWEASSVWQLRGSYSYAEVEVSGPINQLDEGSTPRHMAQLRSFLDLRSDLEIDGALYFVDRREVADVDPYWKLDLGVLWRPRPDLELGLWGQNLIEESRREASALEAVERGAYVIATYRF